MHAFSVLSCLISVGSARVWPFIFCSWFTSFNESSSNTTLSMTSAISTASASFMSSGSDVRTFTSLVTLAAFCLFTFVCEIGKKIVNLRSFFLLKNSV